MRMQLVTAALLVLGLTQVQASGKDKDGYLECSGKTKKLAQAFEWREYNKAEILSESRRIQPNCQYLGVTPLAFGVAHDQLKVVENLLKAGANPNYISTGGWARPMREDQFSPLHVARSGAVVAKLLEFGADPTVREKAGKMPIHFAANDVFNNEAFPLLVAKSPGTLLIADNNGCYPLHYIMHSATGTALILSKLSREAIQIQLTSKCKYEPQSNSYPHPSQPVTPFELAKAWMSEAGHRDDVSVIRILLNYGYPKEDAVDAAIDASNKVFLDEIVATGFQLDSKYIMVIGASASRFAMIMPNISKPKQEELDQALVSLVWMSYNDYDDTIPIAKALLDMGANPRSGEEGYSAIELGNRRCSAQSNPWQPCTLVRFIESYCPLVPSVIPVPTTLSTPGPVENLINN